MAWNLVNVVAHGGDSAGLYPVPDGSKVGVVQNPGDTNPVSHGIFELQILRRVDDAWKRVYYSRGNKGSFIVTDERLVFAFQKVPTSRSMFTPVALVQAASQVGKHKGESLVGHVPLRSLSVIATRNFSPGLSDNLPGLRLAAQDGTVDPSVMVMAEVIFEGRTKASLIGDDILRRTARQRATDPAFASSTEHLAKLAELSSRPFNPPKKTWESRGLDLYVPVRRR